MAWHIAEKLLEQVAEHSTLVGKFWVTLFFVLRFLMVVSIADNVFEDEQEEWVCNTLSPGCENVCFNEFSPLSLIRLWALQILFVALPSIVFMIYTAHKLAKIDEAKKRREKEAKTKQAKKSYLENPPGYYSDSKKEEQPSEEKAENEKKGEEDENKDGNGKPSAIATKLDSDTPSKLLLAYVAQVVGRLVMEVFFIFAHFHLYVFKMWIPELFVCTRWPCPNAVHCFVSRPKEKTLILWIMFGSSIAMIVLNLLELYHLGISKITKAWRNRHHDITKKYKDNLPNFGHQGRRYYRDRYPNGYPQTTLVRMAYARSSISGTGDVIAGDQYIPIS